jgi:hypothetical protein
MRAIPLVAFPEDLHRIILLEELSGITGRDLLATDRDSTKNESFFERARIALLRLEKPSTYQRASEESVSWVDKYEHLPIEPILEDLVTRYTLAEIQSAERSVEVYAGVDRNPLDIARIITSVPIRLSLYIFAIWRHYGAGGEPVDIASGLPPKPPAPGHWGGRTPGYEQPLPPELFGKDLEAGEPRP